MTHRELAPKKMTLFNMSGLADNPSWEGERGILTSPRYASSTLSNVKNLAGAEKASSVIIKTMT